MIDETGQPDAGDWLSISQARFESGYWCGMRQPAMVVSVRVMQPRVEVAVLRRLDQLRAALFHRRLESAGRLDPVLARHPLLAPVSLFALDVLAEAGMPVMSGARALRLPVAGGQGWLLGLPAFRADVDAPRLALSLAVKVLNLLAASVPVSLDLLRSHLKEYARRYRPIAPSGVNTLNFLQAAHDLGIPWRHVANNVFQFGWGSRARWLDSSFTDETSNISARLARDKVACAKVLRVAGLPVPRHHLVTTPAQALDAARSLGYPVVVKPADQDGGRGVHAGLRTPEAVASAYVAAAKFSKRILVEQFIVGNDYRLQVCLGDVYWVVHRRPAYVVGDGASTVAALIERNNSLLQAEHDPSREQGFKPILADEEVERWLAWQGLALASVPAQGQSVRLRGAANVNLGGTREPVLAQAHPDNLALAARAAAVLRLDLAGIDLLLPDIRRSWRETGGGICEVNAQPQMSGHLQREILPRLVARKGRIPVVMLVGPAPLDALAVERGRLVEQLESLGVRLGWVDDGGAWVGDEAQCQAQDASGPGCSALLVDPRVDALVWHCTDWPSPLHGLPVDQVDLVVALGAEMLDRARSDSVLLAWVKRAGRLWRLNSDLDAARLADLCSRLVPCLSDGKTGKLGGGLDDA